MALQRVNKTLFITHNLPKGVMKLCNYSISLCTVDADNVIVQTKQ